MTKLHPGLEGLFANLGVKIHDCADKEVNAIEQLSELLMFGSLPDLRETAHYSHEEDRIYMPKDSEDYDIVAAHELIHWTGHKTRLARPMGYAEEICCSKHGLSLEEMVAETGSLMLCVKLGITPKDDGRKTFAFWRLTFGGSSTHSEEQAEAIALRDAEKAVAYILDLARKVNAPGRRKPTGSFAFLNEEASRVH
jgi:antirestriction protein ArdC